MTLIPANITENDGFENFISKHGAVSNLVYYLYLWFKYIKKIFLPKQKVNILVIINCFITSIDLLYTFVTAVVIIYFD